MALKFRTPPRTISPRPVPEFFYGWRNVYVDTPDGRRQLEQIPLTAEEALHPEEGYVMPENTEHARLIDSINEMLKARYANTPDMAVFSDLVIAWDNPQLKTHCPDVMVIPNVRERDKKRGQFVVAKEGTRPIFVVEIVSASSKEADRVTKVGQYARAGVREYVYVDSWRRTRGEHWEIAGFRLMGDHYLPMLPDEDGSLYCETVGLRMGLKDGEVWMQDYETGEYLLTNLEAQAARRLAETRAAEEKAAREALEVRLAEMEAKLRGASL